MSRRNVARIPWAIKQYAPARIEQQFPPEVRGNLILVGLCPSRWDFPTRQRAWTDSPREARQYLLEQLGCSQAALPRWLR
jgi:hypothetical protein